MAKDKLYKNISKIDNALLLDFAKKHRHFSTEAETILWERLRRNALGVKFRRQHVIGQYILDFACLSRKFYIEIAAHIICMERNWSTTL